MAIISLFLFIHPFLYGNSTNFKISPKEFLWTLTHPKAAINIYKSSVYTVHIVDSIEQSQLLSDRSGGSLDAFKHALWTSEMASRIGVRKALKFGILHEKANYRQFRRDRSNSRYAHSKMDSLNNAVAIQKRYFQLNDSLRIQAIIKDIKKGEFYILNKDEHGNLLDCKNQKIIFEPRKWKNGICIIRSK